MGAASFNGYEQNKLWVNRGNGRFTEVGWSAGGDLMADCRSAAVADFDRDGRMDIAVRAQWERSSLLRNEGEAGRFLRVRLVGTKSNRMGVGARLEAHVGGRRRIAELTCGTGFLSQHESAVHFGLDNAERVDRLVVRWPSGAVQELKDVPADRFVTITEGAAEATYEEPRAGVAPPRRPAFDADPYVAALREGKFTSLDGKAVSGASLMKEATLLHVWSPSCRGCARDSAMLETLHQEADAAFTVLAVAVDATVEEVRAFVGKQKATYPIVVAADEATARRLLEAQKPAWVSRYQSFGWFRVGTAEADHATIPWSGVIDGAGMVRRWRGPIKLFEARLDIAEAVQRARGARR